MTQLTNEPLITEQSAQPDFITPAIIGASFYGTSGSVQTALIDVTDFVGTIKFQATLNDIADQAVWFDVDEYSNSVTPITQITALNLIGNFVFVRAVVTDFTNGIINSVVLSY